MEESAALDASIYIQIDPFPHHARAVLTHSFLHPSTSFNCQIQQVFSAVDCRGREGALKVFCNSNS